MTVVYDLLGFQNRDHGERGIARYVLNLALAIEKRHPDFVDQYLVHPHLPVPAGAERLVASGKLTRTDARPETRRPSAGGTFIAGSLFELNEPLDVTYPSWARSPAWRTAAVLYDLIPLRFEEWYLTNPAVRYPYLTRVAALASMDHLLSISQASADDANEFLGVESRRISVIHAGADQQFRPPEMPYRRVAETLSTELESLRPGYVLFPTGIEPRKNVDRTLEAYAALPADKRTAHQLVLVCRVTDEDRAALHVGAVELGIEDDLLVTGYVSDELLVRLYQGSELVTFPSLYEGFGLPPFEALRCGAPVICSDSSSLREVQTDPAMRFDPYSIDSMIEALASNLPCTSPDGEVRRQPSPDYSWERAADITVEALCRLEKLTLASDRPRLGLVTPVPPQASGIATYAARMIEHLRHHFDITVFHDPAMGEADPIDGVEIEPVDRLPMIRSGGRGFDHLVYFLGNSTFHVEALEMLKREPGIVLLHDVRLTGLYGEVWRLHPERLVGGTVGSMLAAYYSWRYRPMVEEQQVISPELADRFGIVMTRGVVEDAERVLTHSDYAATLVELDSGERPLVPFAIPVPEREPLDDLSFEPVISTFGIVAPVKCPELLIDALALVSQRVPGATLRFVGGIDDLLLAELTCVASRLGLGDAVTFTGHVTDAEFEAEQRRAAVAVQLRAFTNGESSAAVTETLAIGLPTVVSDMGAMAELPESAVVRFDHDSGAIGLADELVDLLTSSGRRASLRSGALAYAADQTFAAAARRLAEVITSSA